MLDLKVNVNLTRLTCHDSLLTFLDVRNGNNSNFTYLNSLNNPALLAFLLMMLFITQKIG